MPSQKSAWIGLYVLAFAVFGVITIEVVPIGLLPDISIAFETDKATAGLLTSSYAALVALCAVPLTLATRHVARKPLLLATLAIFTISSLAGAFAPSFMFLLATRMVGGVAHALFFAIVIGYAARIAPPGQFGRAIALVSTGTSAGLVFGVPAGTALADAFGWRFTFAILGVLVGLAGLVAVKALSPVEHDAAEGKKIVPGGFPMLLVAAMSGANFFGFYMLYTYVSPFLLDAGLGKEWLSITLVLLGVAGLVGIRIAAPRLDKRPYAWLVLVPIAVAAAQVGVLLVFPNLWPVLIIATLWALAWGPHNSTYQNTLVRFGKDNPEMSGAWINATSNVGIGGGGIVGGLLVESSGYVSAGFIGAAVLAGVAILALALRRTLTVSN